MPQLDPVSFSSQLFWLTLSFVVLYVVLARFLLPRVHSIFEVRTKTIGSDLEQAGMLQSQAQKVKDAYEQALAETRAKAKAIIYDTRAQAAAVAGERQAELDKIIEKKLVESDAGIAKAKKEVMSKLLPVSGDLAQKIVEIVINHKPDSGELDSVVNKLAKDKAA
jgi:F-type H+-transporting ATPase subunit b